MSALGIRVRVRARARARASLRCEGSRIVACFACSSTISHLKVTVRVRVRVRTSVRTKVRGWG